MENSIYQPRIIFWEVTKGCNLRCIDCRATAWELPSPIDLPKTKALNIVERFPQSSLPCLVLSGGEPLFRSDIFEIASYARDRGLRLALATNGTLVSREVAQRTVDAGVRRVSISLDGADAATHDGVRALPGAFDKALRGLRNLTDLGMVAQINMTVGRHNSQQIPDMLGFARRIGADALHLFPMVSRGCKGALNESPGFCCEDYQEMLDWLRGVERGGEIELKVACGHADFSRQGHRRVRDIDQTSLSHSFRGVDGPVIGPTELTMPGSTGIALHPYKRVSEPGRPDRKQATTKGAVAGNGVAFISYQGEVYPCEQRPVMAGNLDWQNWHEIGENATVLQEFREAHDLAGQCGCCEFLRISTGCRAWTVVATDSVLSDEPYCAQRPFDVLKNNVSVRSNGQSLGAPHLLVMTEEEGTLAAIH